MAVRGATSLFNDLSEATALSLRSSGRRVLWAWIYVPFGITCVMAVCFGVHSLISLSSVSFPASVACMILLFLSLVLSEITIGDRNTKKLVSWIDVPCGFALRYINIFFCPAFVTLPLSPAISGVEVAKIIAVFIVGYALLFSFTAYFVRGLQLLLGTSKRAMTERAEELGQEDDSIPLTEVTPQADPRDNLFTARGSLNHDHTEQQFSAPSDPTSPVRGPQAPLKAQDPTLVKGTGGPPEPDQVAEDAGTVRALRHNPPELTRAQRWATTVSSNLDMLTYVLLLCLTGLPVYYAAGYAMPVQLCLNVVFYLLALRLPPKYKTFLHPVLVSSAFTIVGIWILALVRRDSLKDGLQAYTTGAKYTQLWDQTPHISAPGAGDVFSSVLDVSIVALGLPMFQYRKELKARFLSIIIPNITLSIGSLLVYPMFCHTIGISAPRSLAFASRSLTLALATPATTNLGGDLYTVAPLCIFSGIIGVIVGPWALKALRIPQDDYITRGITLGANSSAVATALLLTTDPRAAAFSSLSMGLFGTITVALTSVPPLVRIIQSLAGLD